MRTVKEGAMPPSAAQTGLKPTLRQQGYFLACLCRPDGDLEVALPGDDVAPSTPAVVIGKRALNRDILQISLRCERPFSYHAGQFVHLRRDDGLTRSYSISNLPNAEGVIELHVRRLNGGVMSGWIHDELQVGAAVRVAGPHGDCYYTPDNREDGLLLIGTGSGLAPLVGIVRDALQQGHCGPIQLYHGSYRPEGLYLVEELRRLSVEHPSFIYAPCVDEGDGPAVDCRVGRSDQTALCEHPDLKGWRVYLCGHPEMVKSAKRRAFLAGASMRDIFADPFVISAPAPNYS
jgi:NAD(P)H-flavin reductase